MSLWVETELWHSAEVDDGGGIWGVSTIAAAEAAGLITPVRADAWRRLHHDPPPATGDVAAAERHLEGLLEAKDRRPFHGALAALAEAGILDSAARQRWRDRALAFEAPWLSAADREQINRATGWVAIAGPPGTPEEEAAIEAQMARAATMSRKGEVLDVLATREVHRHEGLAVLAAITRTDSTEVLFHYLGPPQGELGRDSLRAFADATDALEPPALTDEAGTGYEPVRDRPISSRGAPGGIDPGRPVVVTGAWRYQPPSTATAFTAEWRGAGWELSSR